MKRKPIFIPRITQCPYKHPYGYIYLYTNKFNEHKYIGKHKFSEPKIDLFYKGSGGVHWKNAILKYGWENFSKEVLFWLDTIEGLTDEEHNEILNQKEKFFIDLFGTFENPLDYNETTGGDGIASELMKGKLNPMYGRSGELNPMYGKKGKESPWYGKTHTEETKQKISRALSGKSVSEETKLKISKANSGRKNNENQRKAVTELCKKRVKELNPMWKGGKVIKNPKHSEFMKGKHMSIKTEFTSENSSGANNSQARPIVQLSLDGQLLQTYGYLSEVKKDPRFPSDEAVRACCKGRKSQYKGFKWMYLEDYNKLIGKEVSKCQ